VGCETTQDPGQAPLEFTRSPEAQGSFDRLTRNGTTIPSAAALDLEINGANSLTGRLHTPPCETCGVETPEEGRTVAGEALEDSSGNYTYEQREALVEQIIRNGPDAMGTTTMTIGGQTYEVMNDNVSLPDGTYVPLTFPEAQRIASAWGWDIPNSNQIRSIRSYAENDGHVYSGITRSNDYEADRRRSIAAMMNDDRMRERASRGRGELINGHFKWYTNNGEIMGLRGGSRGYYHVNASGAHTSQPHYTDYSHGVRLIRRVN
jgi:hypothetical protein